MNYLQILNNFWILKEKYFLEMNCNTSMVYLYLLNIYNRLGRQNPFYHRDIQIASSLNISVNTVKDGLNTLEKSGFITYERLRKKSTKITLIIQKLTIENGNNSKWVSNFDTQIDANFDTQVDTINRVKEYKRIREEVVENKESNAVQTTDTPTLHDIFDYFSLIEFEKLGIDKSFLEENNVVLNYYNKRSESNWIRKNNKPITSWKRDFIDWCKNELPTIKSNPQNSSNTAYHGNSDAKDGIEKLKEKILGKAQ